MASALTAPAPSSLATLADLGVLAASFRRSLRARNRSPRTVDGYLEGVERFHAYLVRMGMPTAAAHIHREHVE
ncbi:MAG: integrase, partial [Chloroflexota bacterium]|nr:integrase [Chloroflexota bacterium]